MRVVAWVAAAMYAVMLAGCSSSGGGSPATTSQDFPSASIDVQPTATTGVIKGVVVDDAIRPIVGVTIGLAGTTQSASTNSEGAFGFEGLAPGTYFMSAHKIGYKDVQASADVVAGVADPDQVKIKMQADPRGFAYYTPYVHDFYIECTTSVVVTCGAPNLVTGFICDGLLDPVVPPGQVCLGNVTADTFTWDTYFDMNATLIQTELIWTTTQTLSPDLFMQNEALESTCDGDNLVTQGGGASPLLLKADEERIRESDIGGDCPIYYSIFSGDTAGTPAGVTIEQRGTAYIHAFYQYLPPEDWRFSEDTDGDPPLPP